MLELVTKPVRKLGIISTLFELLHEHSILYCHWKSNEHLEASMYGLTDLDVLFAEGQRETVERLLNSIGFKKFHAIRQKRYKDIVDFLMLDPESGKVIHVHTHYRLTMGEPFLKGYQFTDNLESSILHNRIFDEHFGLYCIHPAFELILLFVRESLKIRSRDIVLNPFRKRTQYNEFVLREYRWLKERTNDAELWEVIRNYFHRDERIYELVRGSFDYESLRRLGKIMKDGPHVRRLYTPTHALFRRWYREGTVILSRKLSPVISTPILFKRINPRGGKVIAVIGADGSGKSTITTDLKTGLSAKLDVFKIYFGRGDGKASTARRMLNSFKPAIKNTKGKSGKQRSSDGFPKSIFKGIEALIVAWEKRINVRLMKRAKKKGALVICDRFPQNQFMGLNDGPLLHHYVSSSNPVLRTFANIEAGTYRKLANEAPDLLIKLVADAEVVASRKPGETLPDRLENKIASIKAFEAHPHTKVVVVDASRPLDEVLYQIRQEVWRIM